MDGATAFTVFAFVVIFLLIGRRLYLRRWPNGLFPRHIDPERERWRRQKRTRVLMHGDREEPGHPHEP